ADNGFAAVFTCIDDGLDYVLASFDGFDGFDTGGHGTGKQLAGCFDAFALGRFHGNEALEGFGGNVQFMDERADPVVGKLHFRTASGSGGRRFAASEYRRWRSAS